MNPPGIVCLIRTLDLCGNYVQAGGIAGCPGSAYCRNMDSELRAGEGLQWIDVALFRRLAGDDLNLWRDLVGRGVESSS